MTWLPHVAIPGQAITVAANAANMMASVTQ
jgi:hypothetical protein